MIVRVPGSSLDRGADARPGYSHRGALGRLALDVHRAPGLARSSCGHVRAQAGS